MFLKVFYILLFLKLSSGIKSDESCGVVDQTGGLIVGGHEVKEKEWPWSVAIFYRQQQKVKYKFMCGGTLITRKKVITAAHCIHEKYTSSVKQVKGFVLKLGACNIAVREEGSISVKPTSITIHPDWSPRVLSYDADIAIFELPNEVSITKFIRPICIWERRRGAPQFQFGVVVGWGLGEREKKFYENIARKIKIPIINNENCFLDQRQFSLISSNRTFCGGSKDGQGPCKGDSGSGLFFEHGNKFYLGGIVSASTLDVFHNCDVKNYAVYTDFYKFIPWLSNKKFNEKSSFELACDTYKNKRPSKRPVVNNDFEIAPNEAEVGEFPHMALIGYAKTDGIEFRRNGFLVSEKFVLTSAYSITSDLFLVRLGAITTEFKDKNGVPVAVDIDVKRTIRHENYDSKTKENDIGLIELAHDAPLSYFIWPACLFTHVDDFRRMWTASSWQYLNDDSPQKFFQKVPVQEISINECQASLEGKRKLTPQHLCASSIIKNIAICSGSSGDPLQMFLDGDNYYVGAISSFGVSCDVSFLSAYTRVSSHADWIEEIVWAEEASTKIDTTAV